MENTTVRHTCLKLEAGPGILFVKGTWYPTRFDIAVTDGLHAWACDATEEEVAERAAQWDQSVSEYIQLAERYLGFQQPGSVYGFADAGDGCKRLSWTFEKEGTKLEWRWKFRPSPDEKKTTAGILDFLMDANIRLSEEVVRKTRSCERLKTEAEKSLAQSEKICSEKLEFENAVYAKFLTVLNSKKAKLRKLRDQVSKQGAAKNFPVEESAEEEESTDKTESYDSRSDTEKEEPGNLRSTSKDTKTGRGGGRGRKRISGKQNSGMAVAPIGSRVAPCATLLYRGRGSRLP